MSRFLHHKTVRKFAKILFWIMFVVYIGYMVEILFLSSYRIHNEPLEYNLVPFKTIWMYIEYFDHFNFNIWFSNLFGNILAFMPLGFIVPLLVRRMIGIVKIIFLSFLTTLLVETIQITYHVGGFDVDDILLNTVGGVLGYIFLMVLNKNFKMIDIPQTFD